MAWIDRDRFGFLGRLFQFRSMRPDLDAEVDAEIDYHLDRTEAELVDRGVPRAEARRRAERRFGDVDLHRRRLLRIHRRRGRRERMIALFESVVDSFRHAARSLRASPGVTLTVMATLALGIGANATMFGVVDRILLRAPAHIQEPERVVRLYRNRQFIDRRVTSPSVTYPDFRDWTRADSFSSVAVLGGAWNASPNTTIGHGADAVRVVAHHVSPSLFPLLGVRPLHGRFFADRDDVVGAADVVVLGHDFWQRRFGGDPDVIGEDLIVEGSPHEIVGVAPPRFTDVDLARVDLWTPLRSSATGDPEQWEDSRGYYWLQAVGRLAPGATVAEAEAEATALHRAGRADEERYDPEARVLVSSVIAARGAQPSDESVVARWLAGVSAIVLLIACANVANILLARSTRRRRDIGVRLALGISRRRLLGQLLLESVLLASLGGLAALLLAHWGSQAVRSVLLPGVYWAEPPLNLRVLGFTFVAALVTGLLAGLVPAWHATRQRVVAVLGGGGRSGGGERSRFRAGMLVLQTALSVVLLVGAGLFIRSLGAASTADLGFDPDGVIVAYPELDQERIGDGERQLYEQALRRVRGLAAVESAAVSMTTPFYNSYGFSLTVPDVPDPPVFSNGGPYLLAVGEGYFATMEIRIVEGRGFGASDGPGAADVAIVEEGFARAYWPGEDPLGKCLQIGGEEEACTTVIGVAEDSARQSLEEVDEVQYYVPLSQLDVVPQSILARVEPAHVSSMVGAIRRELLAVDEAVRFANVRPLRDLIDPHARAWRLGASMFSAFGLLALVIAAVGLYGVLSFDVAQRSHEIGVRSALGAEARAVVRLVVGGAMTLVAGSLVLGLALALVAGRWVEPLLYRVDPADPMVLVGVAVVLLLVAALAATIPARRAARVDPVVALRSE